MVKDYYNILEVDRSASERDIKKSYRNLSKKYHPDKNIDNEDVAEIWFKMFEQMREEGKFV